MRDKAQFHTAAKRGGAVPSFSLDLLNSYATVGDSQGKLENFYLGQAATGQTETPEALARAIETMTADRICQAMETVRLDTVYFLKGKEAEA